MRNALYLEALARVSPDRQHILPVSIAYAPRIETPHRLDPVYPAEWRGISDRLLREASRTCATCSSVDGQPQRCAVTRRPRPNRNGYVTRAKAQVAHLHHNPCELNPRFMRVLCSVCHRAYDKIPHQGPSSAVTMAIQGNLLPERLEERLADLREATGQSGLFGVGPGAIDLLVIRALVGGGPMTVRDLSWAVVTELPGLIHHDRQVWRVNGPELTAMVRAALIRLAARDTRETPLVDGARLIRMDGRSDNPRLSRFAANLQRLTCAPTADGRAPMTQWTSARWAHH